VHVLLALVAVTGAARMITHPKPVYAALYFILVILAVAVNLLLLQAEFMAFALLIVYAGAILITYLFVLMLASQSGDREARGEEAAWYDRTPRQPGMALVLSFVLLAATRVRVFVCDARRSRRLGHRLGAHSRVCGRQRRRRDRLGRLLQFAAERLRHRFARMADTRLLEREGQR